MTVSYHSFTQRSDGCNAPEDYLAAVDDTAKPKRLCRVFLTLSTCEGVQATLDWQVRSDWQPMSGLVQRGLYHEWELGFVPKVSQADVIAEMVSAVADKIVDGYADGKLTEEAQQTYGLIQTLLGGLRRHGYVYRRAVDWILYTPDELDPELLIADVLADGIVLDPEEVRERLYFLHQPPEECV